MKSRRFPARPASCVRGWTLVEVLCVLAIVGALLGMLFPAVQQARESSRQTACQNKLRQLALATHGWEGAGGRFPPGTLGFHGPVNVTGSELQSAIDSPGNRFYWRGQPHTSWLVQILPWVEQRNLSDPLPGFCTDVQGDYATFRAGSPGSPEWLDGFPEVRDASSTVVPVFLCPSDEITAVPLFGEHPTGIGAQPLYITDLEWDLIYQRELVQFNLKPAPTNYAGCTGAYSGGELPEMDDRLLGSMKPTRGIFRSRRSCSFSEIGDGASNTLLVGETIGFIRNRVRCSPPGWFFGGLARARSKMVWGQDYSLDLPGLRQFGDAWYAWPVGFGSMHPGMCNFARADGSVSGVRRDMAWPVYRALAGVEDGEVITFEF